MAQSGTGHRPANDSAATFPLSLFLIQTPVTNHLPRHYPDNSTMYFEIPLTVFVPPGERNLVDTLGLVFCQPLNQFYGLSSHH